MCGATRHPLPGALETSQSKLCSWSSRECTWITASHPAAERVMAGLSTSSATFQVDNHHFLWHICSRTFNYVFFFFFHQAVISLPRVPFVYNHSFVILNKSHLHISVFCIPFEKTFTVFCIPFEQTFTFLSFVYARSRSSPSWFSVSPRNRSSPFCLFYTLGADLHVSVFL